MVTLGVDYGASHVGIALVETTHTGKNIPLFAGTIHLDARWLKDKVETRASIRRLRRTRKSKKARLRRLHESLHCLNLPSDVLAQIIRFCKRRGYKSLFDESDDKEDKDTREFTREEFFHALENLLTSLLPDQSLRLPAFSACERVLNRQGLREGEIRPLRIDNRGVSRCAWEAAPT